MNHHYHTLSSIILSYTRFIYLFILLITAPVHKTLDRNDQNTRTDLTLHVVGRGVGGPGSLTQVLVAV